LVFQSSTIVMMHGPINIRTSYVVYNHNTCTLNKNNKIQVYKLEILYTAIILL